MNVGHGVRLNIAMFDIFLILHLVRNKDFTYKVRDCIGNSIIPVSIQGRHVLSVLVPLLIRGQVHGRIKVVHYFMQINLGTIGVGGILVRLNSISILRTNSRGQSGEVIRLVIHAHKVVVNTIGKNGIERI